MTARTVEASPQLYARVAGFLYLTLLPLGLFGLLYVPSRLMVPGDAAATAKNIIGSESLFRLSIVTAFLVHLINIFVVLILYQLLKPVNRRMALLMVIFLLLGVPIAMFNEINNFAVLRLLHGPDNGLITLFLDLHETGIQIAGIFWGFWLFPMGYLVYKSGFLPRILGVLLIVAGLGILVESGAAFLLPNNKVGIGVFTFWGEVLFPLWLLIRGVNVERWDKRARGEDK